MPSASLRLSVLAACYCAAQGPILTWAQPPANQLNPTVKKIVEEVSEERIGAIMKRLGDFGTRYVASETDNPTHGIGGASKLIESEFKSYSPRLEVSLQPFSVPKTQRTPKDLDLVNIVAVLPGAIDKDRYVIISGHYDSTALRRPTNGAVRTDEKACSITTSSEAMFLATAPSENYANQHTTTDTFEHASVPYTARVAKMNASVLATLALAPKPPQVTPTRGAGRGAAPIPLLLARAIRALAAVDKVAAADGAVRRNPASAAAKGTTRWPAGQCPIPSRISPAIPF
jgi:hypothetical protein